MIGLGDDALVLSHRLAEWITRAPQLEEDLALANISLDLLGQARTLLSYAGEVAGAGRDEDDLAYLRSEREFRNVQIVEIPNGDFAVTIARQLIFSAYQFELYTALLSSADETLAALAAKAVKEVDYHRDHASQWTLRLGDGTEQSHARMQAALEATWPYVEELFDPTDIADQLAALPGIAVDPATRRPAWSDYLRRVLVEATLV
jgi:ring-1,2-phenylacetyl-CoA epoxidase subunit PaaC